MSAFDIYDLGQMIVDASEDDHLAETQLMSLIQMMKVLLEKHHANPQPQPEYQPNFPQPMQPLRPVRNLVQAAREADPNTPDFILDPTNPNSKAMRGRVRNMEEVLKQGSGAGYEEPDVE